jgi:hypothetical protein
VSARLACRWPAVGRRSVERPFHADAVTEPSRGRVAGGSSRGDDGWTPGSVPAVARCPRGLRVGTSQVAGRSFIEPRLWIRTFIDEHVDVCAIHE